MLVHINDMLSQGFIAGLIPSEEILGLASNLRQEATRHGIPDTPANLEQYWKDKLRNNMHTILCFSPVGDAFRTRARKFPGLITCAMIDYFHAWPPEALMSVAMKYLSEVQLTND